MSNKSNASNVGPKAEADKINEAEAVKEPTDVKGDTRGDDSLQDAREHAQEAVDGGARTEAHPVRVSDQSSGPVPRPVETGEPTEAELAIADAAPDSQVKAPAPMVAGTGTPVKSGPGTPVSGQGVPNGVPSADARYVHVYPQETGYEYNIRIQEEAKRLVPRADVTQ